MVELIIIMIVVCLAIYGIIFGSIFFVAGMAYSYWGLSIGMAPVLWLFMIIGAIVGFVCAFKNAIKAAKAVKIKE